MVLSDPGSRAALFAEGHRLASFDISLGRDWDGPDQLQRIQSHYAQAGSARSSVG